MHMALASAPGQIWTATHGDSDRDWCEFSKRMGFNLESLQSRSTNKCHIIGGIYLTRLHVLWSRTIPKSAAASATNHTNNWIMQDGTCDVPFASYAHSRTKYVDWRSESANSWLLCVGSATCCLRWSQWTICFCSASVDSNFQRSIQDRSCPRVQAWGHFSLFFFLFLLFNKRD